LAKNKFALPLIYSRNKITAASDKSETEALEKGLVSELCKPEALLDRARSLALDIAGNCSPVALALTRRLLWKLSPMDSPRRRSNAI
jgi:enoyl-CoA hydratase/carnithine racemase